MNITILAAALILAASVVCGGAQNHDPQKTDTANTTVTEGTDMQNKIDFERITLTESGMMAEQREYEISKTSDGVEISCYCGRWNYIQDGDREDFLEKRITGGVELYDRVTVLLAQCRVDKWDGFSGYDPLVLDGSRFTLEVVLPDGSSIDARGDNSFPDKYHTFLNGIYDLLNEK